MSRAFLFPGQGIGIGRELGAWLDHSSSVRDLVEPVLRGAGAGLRSVLSEAGRNGLSTELLEPLHTALCLGIHADLMQRGISPDFIAGHSLGEVAACAAAGCCDRAAAVELAGVRGRLMAREAAVHPGGLVVLNCADEAAAEAAVAFARERGIANLATLNLPGQFGISGDWPALRHLATRYAVTPVRVAGPWHSDLLAGAVEELRCAARRAVTKPLSVPLVCNRTGDAVASAADVPDLLAGQLVHPVLWARSLETLAALGVTEAVTVGPGRMLRMMIHGNVSLRWSLRATDTPDELERWWGALTP